MLKLWWKKLPVKLIPEELPTLFIDGVVINSTLFRTDASMAKDQYSQICIERFGRYTVSCSVSLIIRCLTKNDVWKYIFWYKKCVNHNLWKVSKISFLVRMAMVLILVPFGFFLHPTHPWGCVHIDLNKSRVRSGCVLKTSVWLHLQRKDNHQLLLLYGRCDFVLSSTWRPFNSHLLRAL